MGPELVRSGESGGKSGRFSARLDGPGLLDYKLSTDTISQVQAGRVATVQPVSPQGTISSEERGGSPPGNMEAGRAGDARGARV
jgi:hypothetical protein